MGRKRNNKGAKNDVKADASMAAAVRKVQEILREHSEQEIRTMLIECNLNHYVAIERLVSQQELRNQQGTSTQLPDSSTTLVPNQSAIPNGVTMSVPISSNKAAPTLPVPSSSDVTNGEPRTVAISSSEAVPPLSVPSSRPLTKVKPKIQDTRMISASGPTMTEVVQGLHVPSKQNVTKTPVKADSPLLHQKPDATNPISNSFTQPDAARDPQHSAFPMDTRQSIATASLLGPRPPTFMAEAFGIYPSSEPHINQQDMNRGQFPSGQYGNMINSPYRSYDMQPSAPIQKRGGGSNSNTLAHHVNMMNSPHSLLEQNEASIYESMESAPIYKCLESVFAQYRNNTLPLSSTSLLPSSHASAYGAGMSSGNAARLGYADVLRNYLPSNPSSASTGPSSHGSSYGAGMSSGNAANSRLGYEDVSRNQGRSPFVWRQHGEDSYRSIPPHNQQEREAYFERIRADLASQDQENNNTSDPFDQTQQRPRDK